MTFLDKLLGYYQLTKADYEHLTRSLTDDDLPNPHNFSDLPKIMTRIEQAIVHNQKIIVYGDYDADGVLATSILVDAFKKRGVAVGYYLPNRYQDGYGLNVSKVLDIKQKDYQLIITVDNGANAVEAINKAYELGIDVIITDHHEINGEVPLNVGILHPFLQQKPYPMCGATMAFILARELLHQVDRYHLALAAIATISDMMPLRDINRDLVRLGLAILQIENYPQITLLNENQIVDAVSISMKIAPAINAIGRLVENSNINRLVKYFTSTDNEEIISLASWIKTMNSSRQTMMKDAVMQLPNIDGDVKAIVHLSNEKEGLIGLLANRLMNKYDVPCIVFTPNSANPSELVGSARTPKGYDLTEAFKHVEPWMIKGGGHANAGGLTINVKQYERFKQAFISYFDMKEQVLTKYHILDVSLSEFNFDNYQLIETFGPFGQDFKAPLFRISHLKTSALSYIKNGQYLATKLSLDTKLLSFKIGQKDLNNYEFVNLIGEFSKQTYRNMSELVFLASKFEPD